MKKVLLLLLAAVMLFSIFACTKNEGNKPATTDPDVTTPGTPPPGTTTPGTTVPGTTVSPDITVNNPDKPDLELMTFNGKKLRISSAPDQISLEVFADETAVNIRDQAVWERNAKIEELYDVKISPVSTGDGSLRGQVTTMSDWIISGDDFYDSFLGNTVLKENIGVSVTFSIYAESNLNMEDNGGFFGSGAHDNMLWLIIFLLLLIAIIILIISIFKRQEIKAEQAYVAATSVPEPEPIIPIIVPEPEPEPIIPIIVPEPEPEPVVVPVPVQPEIKKLKFHGKMEYINIDEFEPLFNSGDVITLAILKEKGLISPSTKQMKILARDIAPRNRYPPRPKTIPRPLPSPSFSARF